MCTGALSLNFEGLNVKYSKNLDEKRSQSVISICLVHRTFGELVVVIQAIMRTFHYKLTFIEAIC